MVLSKELEKEVTQITQITKKTASNIRAGKKVFSRNLLISGPKRTGKTMLARNLARVSGMEYVELNGLSFAEFSTKNDAISAVSELFS